MAKTTLAISLSGHSGITGVGSIRAIIVNTHSSGTVKLVDSPNGTSGRVILDTYTLPTGAQTIPLYLSEYYEGVGVILGGTATIQLVTDPN